MLPDADEQLLTDAIAAIDTAQQTIWNIAFRADPRVLDTIHTGDPARFSRFSILIEGATIADHAVQILLTARQ